MYVLVAIYEKEPWYYVGNGKWDQDLYSAFLYPDTAKSSLEAFVQSLIMRDRLVGFPVSYEIMKV